LHILFSKRSLFETKVLARVKYQLYLLNFFLKDKKHIKL